MVDTRCSRFLRETILALSNKRLARSFLRLQRVNPRLADRKVVNFILFVCHTMETTLSIVRKGSKIKYCLVINQSVSPTPGVSFSSLAIFFAKFSIVPGIWHLHIQSAHSKCLLLLQSPEMDAVLN